MKHLLLVRHGESEWNQLGRIQGQTDIPLAQTGILQAQKIGGFLAKKQLSDKIVMHCSPMQRAVKTAQIIARAIEFNENNLQIDERLNDFNLGDIAGTYGWDQVAIDHPELARLRLTDPLNFHPPGGESGTDFRNRLTDFLDQPEDGKIHLIVGHGVANKFIRSIRLGLPGADIISLGESQQSVYELEDNHETEHAL